MEMLLKSLLGLRLNLGFQSIDLVFIVLNCNLFHILQKEDKYFFIPENGGFKSIEKEHMPYIDSIRKRFNDGIGKELLIDAGDYQSIEFGRSTHNTDVSIGDLIFHEEGVTFEYI